jgi:hypothetical protein
MTLELARILVSSLLERLSDDAKAERPRLTGVVSAAERDALRCLLGVPSSTEVSTRASAERESVADEGLPVSPSVAVESTAPQDAIDELTGKDSALAANRGAPAFAEAELEGAQYSGPPAGQSAPNDASADQDFVIDETAWLRSNPSSDGYVLCLDFGTAKSKAFAASVTGDPEDADLVELALGRRDNDLDHAVYTVASSVSVGDDGLMYAGPRHCERACSRESSAILRAAGWIR